MANNFKADLFLSIHRNAFTDAKAHGIEVWTYTNVDEKTKKFANIIYTELVNVYAQSKRGIKSGNLHVLRATSMPAILVELGFISNTIDNQKFDELFSEYVEAVVKGICKCFNTNYNPPKTPETPHKTYIVQRGDTLWSISQKFLGSGEKWPQIQALNGLKSNKIFANQILKIPN